MAELKPCVVCGKVFAPTREWSVCCSKECAKKRANERAKKSHEKRKYAVVVPNYKRGANYYAIADIDLAARKEGLTYGQYVAKYLY